MLSTLRGKWGKRRRCSTISSVSLRGPPLMTRTRTWARSARKPDHVITCKQSTVVDRQSFFAGNWISRPHESLQKAFANFLLLSKKANYSHLVLSRFLHAEKRSGDFRSSFVASSKDHSMIWCVFVLVRSLPCRPSEIRWMIRSSAATCLFAPTGCRFLDWCPERFEAP